MCMVKPCKMFRSPKSIIISGKGCLWNDGGLNSWESNAFFHLAASQLFFFCFIADISAFIDVLYLQFYTL